MRKLNDKIRNEKIALVESIREELSKENKVMFFNYDVKLNNGERLISVSTNSANVLYLTNRMKGNAEFLYDAPLSIIGNIVDIIDEGNNTKSAYTWIAEGDGYYETYEKSFKEEIDAYDNMMQTALDYAKILTDKHLEDINSGTIPFDIKIMPKAIKVDWITYKLILCKA